MRVTLLWTYILLSIDAWCQQSTAEPYYINLNNVITDKVITIENDKLNLQYQDLHEEASTAEIIFQDWQNSTVSVANVDKSFGLNHYVIELSKIGNFTPGEIYNCIFKTSDGKIAFPFKISDAKKKSDLAVNINPNISNVTCKDNVEVSSIEFISMISGGRAPYNCSWYVINESQTNLLYQPKNVALETDKKVSAIKVDANPDYYVVLYVKDACGDEKQRILHMVCDAERKKVNSIFIQQLKNNTFTPNKTN